MFGRGTLNPFERGGEILIHAFEPIAIIAPSIAGCRAGLLKACGQCPHRLDMGFTAFVHGSQHRLRLAHSGVDPARGLPDRTSCALNVVGSTSQHRCNALRLATSVAELSGVIVGGASRSCDGIAQHLHAPGGGAEGLDETAARFVELFAERREGG